MSDEKISMKESLKKMRKDFQTIIESQASLSLILKAKHEALIKAGFTKDEALEIIKARGMMP